MAAERDAIQATRPEKCGCLGTGWVSYWVRWQEPLQSAWCWCSDGQAAQHRTKADEHGYLEELVVKQRVELVNAIGIPPHFAQFSLVTYQPDAEQGWVHAQMVRWAQGEGGSVFIHGAASRGKTGLCLAALADRVRQEAKSGAYWDATALLTELIRGFKDHNSDAMDPVERAERVRYLLLDDIDKIAETPFKLQTIYDLVNKRHNRGLATMFTANAGLPELAAKLGNWTVDRIQEMCGPEWVMELKGRNRRVVAA